MIWTVNTKSIADELYGAVDVTLKVTERDCSSAMLDVLIASVGTLATENFLSVTALST